LNLASGYLAVSGSGLLHLLSLNVIGSSVEASTVSEVRDVVDAVVGWDREHSNEEGGNNHEDSDCNELVQVLLGLIEVPLKVNERDDSVLISAAVDNTEPVCRINSIVESVQSGGQEELSRDGHADLERLEQEDCDSSYKFTCVLFEQIWECEHGDDDAAAEHDPSEKLDCDT